MSHLAFERKRALTIADIAREAGVSKATAGFACSGTGRISPATRERVLKVARELGYEPNQSAKLLANGRSHDLIGFLSLDIDLSVRTRQMQVIQAALNALGYTVPIYGYGYEGSSSEEVQNALIRSMLSQKPRAVVCNTSGFLPQSLARLESFRQDGGIVVCYGYAEPVKVGCDQVVFDTSHSFYLAARHLLDQGHQK